MLLSFCLFILFFYLRELLFIRRIVVGNDELFRIRCSICYYPAQTYNYLNIYQYRDVRMDIFISYITKNTPMMI